MRAFGICGLAFCAALSATSVHAGKEAVDGVGPIFIPPGIPDGGGVTIDTPGVAAATRILDATSQFCAALKDDTYVVDCLAERMRAAANAMPRTGEMAQARSYLQQAADDLEATVQTYRDTARPRVNARMANRPEMSTQRPLAPVRPEALEAAKSRALTILEETETVLLRAADQSAERALAFQQVAAAVGSNKVLLRS